MRTVACAIALLALAGCYRRERVVGTEPTPFVIRSTAVGGAVDSFANEPMSPAADTSAATGDELKKNFARCELDADCTGRLHCVSYRGVSGRELRQCLFSCQDGCPEGWSCRKAVADGPSNTCEQSR